MMFISNIILTVAFYFFYSFWVVPDHTHWFPMDDTEGFL